MTRLVCIGAALAVPLATPSVWPSAQPAAVSQAQEDVRLAPGARVRVQWIDSMRMRGAVGTVRELRTNSLTLFVEPAGARTFALARLYRIDVRVPRSRARGAARGAGLGA